MKIIADMHTHTCVSQHAYSTIDEITKGALESGLKAVAITDHGPGMPDGAIPLHFLCMKDFPKTINGIALYTGAEVNIMDSSGKVDLDSSILANLDFVVASYHVESYVPTTNAEHTNGWLNVIKNPLVDCIGHSGNPMFSCDYDVIIRACKKYGKLVEINSNSFAVRPGSDKICPKIAQLCKDYQVQVCVNSDAHIKYRVGDFARAIEMLEKLNFPEKLIVNANMERLESFIENRRNNL